MSGRWNVLVAVLAVSLTTALVPGAAGSHADGEYDQPIVFEPDTTDVDVVVVPPNHGTVLYRPFPQSIDRFDSDEVHPYENTYTQATLDAVEGWRDGIDAFGPGWLSKSVDIDTYVVGQDDIPTDVLLEPEIVVTAAEEINGVYAGAAVVALPANADGPCVISNTKTGPGESWSYTEFYTIAAHELGHCLGLNHAGAVDGANEFHPGHDLLGHPGLGDGACVSKLNVAGLRVAFAPLVLDKPSEDVATLDVDEYEQIDCHAS